MSHVNLRKTTLPVVALLEQRISLVFEKQGLPVRHVSAVCQQGMVNALVGGSLVGLELALPLLPEDEEKGMEQGLAAIRYKSGALMQACRYVKLMLPVRLYLRILKCT